MSEAAFSALTYLLGFVGLAAVGLIPLRSWNVLRRALNEGVLRTSVFGRLVVASLALAALAALGGDALVTARIFRCLTEAYCGANVASGWIYLAMLGVWYLIFEAIALVVPLLTRTKGRQSKRQGSG